MNHLIKFMTHILLTCFFVCIIGLIVMAVLGYGTYMSGWAWGVGVMLCYLTMLAVQSGRIRSGDVHAGVGKARRQMALRLMTVGLLAAVGLRLFRVEPLSLLLAVLLIQPVLYIVYWRMGR